MGVPASGVSAVVLAVEAVSPTAKGYLTVWPKDAARPGVSQVSLNAGATVDGLVFYGSPWQPKFRIWAFGATRGAELASKWAKIPDRVDVLITHGPPHGFGDRVSWRQQERHVGCADLLARVRVVEPPIHLFGHIHQDRGTWTSGATTFTNVTTNEGASAATVIDL